MTTRSEQRPDARIPVAVLGATGAVGQTFVRLLDGHPLFRLAEVGASERSAGQPYREAASWREGDLPEEIADLVVKPCDPESIESRIVFSALDAAAALPIERAFAQAGAVVLSNARSHRMEPDVPLVIPEVNPDHLALIDVQRAERGWPGAIVTNANCAVTVVALALAALRDSFGISSVFVSTLQALSGAGYPGVASLDAIGNVVPYIGGEEEKIQIELTKLYGSLTERGVEPAPIPMSAHANRVPVVNGHTACLSVSLTTKASVPEIEASLSAWRGAEVCAGLPSAPERPTIVREEPNRPQPRLDVDAGHGMSVVIGRVRPDPIFDVRLVALSHNTVRGAAGGSILNAEVMGRLGMLPGVEEGAW